MRKFWCARYENLSLFEIGGELTKKNMLIKTGSVLFQKLPKNKMPLHDQHETNQNPMERMLGFDNGN